MGSKINKFESHEAKPSSENSKDEKHEELRNIAAKDAEKSEDSLFADQINAVGTNPINDATTREADKKRDKISDEMDNIEVRRPWIFSKFENEHRNIWKWSLGR